MVSLARCHNTYALFMVTFSAYADPKTDWCQRVVRILSMTDVGPRDIAMAYMPNDAPVPASVWAKLTRAMLRNMPIPHTHTCQISTLSID